MARDGIAMAPRQVLFRIDDKLLSALDKKLRKDGYTTRNAWFKDAVASYAGRARKSPRRGAR